MGVRVVLSANGIDSSGCSRLQKGLRVRRCATGLPCRARCAVSTLRAGIPRACARCRSLRAPLATEETGSTPVVTFYCPTPCSSLNPAKRRGPSLRFGLSQGPVRARAKIQARAACLGRAVKVADREVGLRELPTASCEAHRPLNRGRRVGAALPAPGDSVEGLRSATALRLAASMPTHNAAQEPEALRARSHARAAPRIALRLPRLNERQLPHRHRRLSAPTPAQDTLARGESCARREPTKTSRRGIGPQSMNA